MSLTYQKERFVDIMIELPPLFQKHWEEIAANKDVIKLDPAWDEYCELDRINRLHIITIRDGTKLVGYFFGLVKGHLHYKTSLTAWSDIFYLLPEYKKGLAAGVRLRRLIREAEKMFRVLKVQKVYMVTKKAHDLSRLLEREGYKFIELVHTKLL